MKVQYNYENQQGIQNNLNGKKQNFKAWRNCQENSKVNKENKIPSNYKLGNNFNQYTENKNGKNIYTKKLLNQVGLNSNVQNKNNHLKKLKKIIEKFLKILTFVKNNIEINSNIITYLNSLDGNLLNEDSKNTEKQFAIILELYNFLNKDKESFSSKRMSNHENNYIDAYNNNLNVSNNGVYFFNKKANKTTKNYRGTQKNQILTNNNNKYRNDPPYKLDASQIDKNKNTKNNNNEEKNDNSNSRNINKEKGINNSGNNNSKDTINYSQITSNKNKIKRGGSTDTRKLKKINNNQNNINLAEGKYEVSNDMSKETPLSKEIEKQEKIYKGISSDKYKKDEQIVLNKVSQKYQIDARETPKESEIIYKNSNKPKGLYNIGLSCYMNSILQCFYHIPELRNDFIDNLKLNKFRGKPVCKAFAEVMNGLKNEKKDYFVAVEFKNIMGNKNSLFKGFKAGDAKDLFLNLIDSFLNELEEKIDANSEERNVDLTNIIKAFENSESEIQKNVINKLFMGYYATAYYCKKKEEICTYSFNPESTILFNLEKISQYYEINTFTVEDCFEYNFYRTKTKTEFFCEKCKKVEENKSIDIIYRSPTILVLILDRGKSKKFKGKVKIKIDLDLTNFIFNEKKEGNKTRYKNSVNYKLIGVSTHSGTSSPSGHYTACCLADDGKYYFFSDTYVNEIKGDKEKIEKIINENEAYLLFYRILEKNN